MRIISTQDDAVVEAVITATNRQTAVAPHQFFALRPFAKKLEDYFRTAFDIDKRLYYERRAHQYDAQDIPKRRIVTHHNLVRAVGAMFLGEPHRTTRSFSRLNERVGVDFFVDTDRPEIYYASAYAAFRLEELFKDKKLPGKHKSGRHHILLAARLAMDRKGLPPFNSNAIAKRCEQITEALWSDGDKIILKSVSIVDRVAGSNWDPDHIRTQSLTDGILTHFGATRQRGPSG